MKNNKILRGKAESAVRLALSLARHYPLNRTAHGLAYATGISISYSEQILSRLARAGLVRGIRGPGGGYELTRSPENISAADVLVAGSEPDEPSPDLAGIERALADFLAGITLDQVGSSSFPKVA